MVDLGIETLKLKTENPKTQNPCQVPPCQQIVTLSLVELSVHTQGRFSNCWFSVFFCFLWRLSVPS
jgi:hypothetical protein